MNTMHSMNRWGLQVKDKESKKRAKCVSKSPDVSSSNTDFMEQVKRRRIVAMPPVLPPVPPSIRGLRLLYEASKRAF